MPDFHFTNKKDEPATLYILDDIGPEWAGMISDKAIAKALNEIGDVSEIVVKINSPGGDAFMGIAIYNLLASAKPRITTEVIGLAASAASIIAMGGRTIRMAANSMLMIHDTWTFTYGNSQQLSHTASVLDKLDGALAASYAARTGLTVEEIKDLMDKESWFNATEALDKGFADELLPSIEVKASVRNGRYKNTPSQFLSEVDPTIQIPTEGEPLQIAAPPRLAARFASLTNQMERSLLGLPA